MLRAVCVRSTIVALGLAAAFAALPAAAQTRMTAGIRGKVVDEQGQGLPDVKIDMEFLGASRQKITKTQNTDKKGGFVRMGVPDGRWKLTFSKEGYRPYVIEKDLGLGGFSDLDDVVMQKAPVAAPVPEGPVAGVLPAAPEASKAGEAYAAAVEAAKAGRFDEAEAGLKEVVTQFPDLATAHFNLGYVYRQKKDWKAAEAEYRRVTELEPTKSDSFIALAAVRELDGRGAEAIEGLVAAAPGFEQDARFQYALGMTASNSGRTPVAKAAFEKAIALDASNPEPLFQLATIAVGENRIPEAMGLLEKYLAATGQVPANVETAKGLLAALNKKR
jgi:tetratricopeptide (TPR) repeat protein